MLREKFCEEEKAMRMKTTLAMVLLVCFTVTAGAKTVRLATFEAMMKAMEGGEHVRVVIHYAKCKLMVEGKEETAPNAIGGMELKTWEYFGKGVIRNDKAFVTASESVLINNPRLGYVINWVKVRIYDDKSVEIIARYLKPQTHEIVMDESFRGELSTGKDGKGVSCFVK